MAESPPRFPAGQAFIDHQKQRFIEEAAAHGWVAVSRDPLRLTKGEKAIQIDFNGGGIPKSIQWLNGDEFGSMGATGYVNLNELDRWFAWEPEGE